MRRSTQHPTYQRSQRRRHGEKRHHRVFYKRGWFWTLIGIVLCLGLFVMMAAMKQAGTQEQATTQSMSLLQLTQSKVTTNAKGVAVIQGVSTAGTTIMIENTPQTTVAKNGHFKFNYTLKTPQSQTLTIQAKSITNATETARISIIPSAKYLASLRQADDSTSVAASSSSASEAASASAPSEAAASSDRPEGDQDQTQAKAAEDAQEKKTIDWDVANTRIISLETAVADNVLTLTVNWKNIDNQDIPMFVSLFNEPTVQQSGSQLTALQNEDSATALLPQFQNTVGTTMSLKYLFKLNNDVLPLTINLSTKDGQNNTITMALH
ncbi:hypothetical protein ACFQ5M_09755 [Agrilactobacillus yilanensis]|uniref:DUF5067 domain-containing protein n=1 Tax=Agrilactobacillus yilanensis TaxID=2485997 RepID=A0ABW4JBS3_9LACO|nr:hypothetical protein [Agrilactobacillus yilanensis]